MMNLSIGLELTDSRFPCFPFKEFIKYENDRHYLRRIKLNWRFRDKKIIRSEVSKLIILIDKKFYFTHSKLF
jgi:hypothetical protein